MRSLIIILILGYLIPALAMAQWTEPVRLEGPINTDPSSKTWPSINATGDTLYYSMDGANQEDICYSYLLSDSTWSAPINLGSTINDSWRQLSPSIGPGDSILYFVSYDRPGGYGSYDIWFTRRGPDGRWMEPENAGPTINSSGMEWGVFLSRDGRSLYFSSERFPPPSVGLDICRSEWQGDGWEPAALLPGDLNWITDEENVTLPEDESFLILTAARYAPTHVDLLVSYPSDSGWSAPERILDLIGPWHENGASLTPNGNTIYFASMRNDTFPYLSELFISHKTTAIDPISPKRTNTEKSYLYPNPYYGGDLRLVLTSKKASDFISAKLYNLLGQELVLNTTPELSGARDYIIIKNNFDKLPAGKYWVVIQTRRMTEAIPFIHLK